MIKKALMAWMGLFVIGAIVFLPVGSQAKGNDEQAQIVLLNDSASALEDTDPALSKSLSQFADDKEKEWEANNAHKDALSTSSADKNIPQLQEKIKLLNTAAKAIKPMYPVIAQGLIKMAKEMNRVIENEQ